MRDDSRFAAPGSGKHEQRTFDMGYRGALRFREFLQDLRHSLVIGEFAVEDTVGFGQP